MVGVAGGVRVAIQGGARILIVDDGDDVRLMEAGCTGYMVKPVDPEQLLETVRLLTLVGGNNRGTPEGFGDEGSAGG
jgi:hypothetical protein